MQDNLNKNGKTLAQVFAAEYDDDRFERNREAEISDDLGGLKAFAVATREVALSIQQVEPLSIVPSNWQDWPEGVRTATEVAARKITSKPQDNAKPVERLSPRKRRIKL